MISKYWTAFQLWHVNRQIRQAMAAKASIPNLKQERINAVNVAANDAIRQANQQAKQLDVELGLLVDELAVKRDRLTGSNKTIIEINARATCLN